MQSDPGVSASAMSPTSEFFTMRLLGGLGNQMFQFAAGYSLSRTHHKRLVLDTAIYSKNKLRKLELENFSLPNDIEIAEVKPEAIGSRTNVFRKVLSSLGSSKMMIYKEKSHCFDCGFFDLAAPAYIKGYFQSPLYFENYRNELREILRPKAQLSSSNQSYVGAIEQSKVSISVHIRRGDYAATPDNMSAHGVLDQNYYDAAFDLMKNLYGKNINWFIFTDDPVWVKGTFQALENAQAVVGNDDSPLEDLWLMSKCDHNIIANSTFSWWGAWLNTSKGKTVIAPRHWFGREKHKKTPTFDMFPNGWITL